MKNILYIFSAFLMLGLLSCEKNEATPDYTVIGDAYATFVEFSASNTLPKENETIEFTLTYSNYKEDPINYIEVFSLIEGQSSSIQRIEASGAPLGTNTIDVSYVPPVAEFGQGIAVYAELYSSKDFPQIELIDVELGVSTPTIQIDSLINDLPLGNLIFEGAQITYQLTINENSDILYSDLTRLISYYTIGSGAEVIIDTLAFPDEIENASPEITVTIPEGSEGQDVTFRFEAQSIADGAASVSDIVSVETPTALSELTEAFVATDDTDTIGFDLSTQSVVTTGADDEDNDLYIPSFNSNETDISSANGTAFMKVTLADYQNASLNSLISLFDESAADATVSSVAVDDVYIARLRDSDEFVIVKITGILSSPEASQVRFDVKFLP